MSISNTDKPHPITICSRVKKDTHSLKLLYESPNIETSLADFIERYLIKSKGIAKNNYYIPFRDFRRVDLNDKIIKVTFIDANNPTVKLTNIKVINPKTDKDKNEPHLQLFEYINNGVSKEFPSDILKKINCCLKKRYISSNERLLKPEYKKTFTKLNEQTYKNKTSKPPQNVLQITYAPGECSYTDLFTKTLEHYIISEKDTHIDYSLVTMKNQVEYEDFVQAVKAIEADLRYNPSDDNKCIYDELYTEVFQLLNENDEKGKHPASSNADANKGEKDEQLLDSIIVKEDNLNKEHHPVEDSKIPKDFLTSDLITENEHINRIYSPFIDDINITYGDNNSKLLNKGLDWKFNGQASIEVGQHNEQNIERAEQGNKPGNNQVNKQQNKAAFDNILRNWKTKVDQGDEQQNDQNVIEHHINQHVNPSNTQLGSNEYETTTFNSVLQKWKDKDIKQTNENTKIAFNTKINERQRKKFK
jgi:hypothetical protein